MKVHKLYETPEAEIVQIWRRDVVTASMPTVDPDTPEDSDDWTDIIS